jgi:hypothetical protein
MCVYIYSTKNPGVLRQILLCMHGKYMIRTCKRSSKTCHEFRGVLYMHMSICKYVYILIYLERERERDMHVNTCTCVYVHEVEVMEDMQGIFTWGCRSIHTYIAGQHLLTT